VVNEGGMARVVRGVGRVRFQLKYGEFLELDGVLFVPGLRVNLLLVLALEDVGYHTLFKREHVFIYREGVDLMGWTGCICCKDNLQGMIQRQMRSMRRLLRLQWAQGISLAFREKRASLFYAPTGGSAGVVEPMFRVEWILQGALGSRAVRRRSSSSISVQALRMAPSSEGAPTEHCVMGPDDGDGSEYFPR
jgi:hypothetical protein